MCPVHTSFCWLLCDLFQLLSVLITCWATVQLPSRLELLTRATWTACFVITRFKNSDFFANPMGRLDVAAFNFAITFLQ